MLGEISTDTAGRWQRFTTNVFALTDRFVPPGEHHAEHLRRIRTVVFVGWLGIIFAGMSVVLYAVRGSTVSAVAIGVIVLGLIATAPALRRGVSVEAVAHSLITITWLVTFVVAWRTGGFASPAVLWAFFLPIISYIACGRTAAIVWSILSALQVAALYVLQRGGVQFSTDLAGADAESVRFGGLLVAILANALVIGGNEAIRHATEAVKEQASRTVERQRILGDMHDGVGSQLLGLIIQVRAGRIDDERLLQGLNSCLDDLRLIVDSLDPTDRPFDVSLAELRNRMEPRCAAAGIELRWHKDDSRQSITLGPEQSLQVLRALQEMFTNALRHAGTDRIDFEFSGPVGAERMVTVSVRDHGTGFDQGAVRAGGRGLPSLRARTHRLGGELAIEPADPGTRVTLRFAATPSGTAQPKAGWGIVAR